MKASAKLAALVVVTMIMMAVPASAQWSNAGNNYTTGAVSVGTTTFRPPYAKLVVHGGAFGEFHFDVSPTNQFAAGTLRFTESASGGSTFTTLGYLSVCASTSVCAGEMQLGTTQNAPMTLYTNSAARLAITAAGRVNIGAVDGSPVGASDKLVVYGDATVTGNIAAKYQDVAEWVPSAEQYEAGTVVVLNPTQNNSVQASATPYDSTVAGVVSAKPGLILGEAGDSKLMIATTGRVKVKVDATAAPIKIGDLLVTGSKAGFAMKSQPVDIAGRKFHQPGTVIGKALEPIDKGTGEILVLLSMQ